MNWRQIPGELVAVAVVMAAMTAFVLMLVGAIEFDHFCQHLHHRSHG